MSKSTEECKEFINSISSFIGASENDIWKRTKKYKKDDLILRDFENQDGRFLTISELNNNLSLFQLKPLEKKVEEAFTKKNGKGIKYLGKKAKEKDIIIFISECVNLDPEVVNEEDFEDAKNLKSWEVLDGDRGVETIKEWKYYNGSNQCTLHYQDKQKFLNDKDVSKIYNVWIPKFDTRYRIPIFETKDNHLYLGENNPD